MVDSELPTPIHTIQHSRFTREDEWRLDDISLCSSGNIAVSGGHYYVSLSFVFVYNIVGTSHSSDKPALYDKQFIHRYSWPRRYISFINPNSSEIVTCRYNEVQVIDYIRDLVSRSRKVNSATRSLSVSEGQILVGLSPDIVNIYDNDLNEIKSIRFERMEGYWPLDMAAAADRLYVCTKGCHKVIVWSQDSGGMLTPYKTGEDYSETCSVAVNKRLGLIAVLWRQGNTGHKQIIFYPLIENISFLTVSVETYVSRIRISDQGRIMTGNGRNGEVNIYNLASIFTFSYLKENLVSRLGRNDCEKLKDFFAIGEEDMVTRSNNEPPSASLLLALEEKGLVKASDVNALQEAFRKLNMCSFYQALNMYQKLRDQTTSYDRFIATLSTHLTSSVPAELCDYYHVSNEQKRTITFSHIPGLSVLLVLDEMGVIKSSDVGSLEKPFNKFRLKQAVAKIHEYTASLEEENRRLLKTEPNILEEKIVIFVEFLKNKIKSWYETMTPVPWKKSCQWKATDLFVGSGLILTDSKAKHSVHNIDEQCKLNYTEIFSHEKLKSEIRIILESDPGAGKTMLASHLAYGWSQGEIKGVDILIFLPLKIVKKKTLIQAIKEFYIPEKAPLSGKDIDSILASGTGTICLLLDGLEEYSTGGKMRANEPSEVMKIMRKEKYSNCKVVITSRSDFANDLPKCPLLKIGRFGETERNLYIEKLSPEDTDKQQKIKTIINTNPFILDFCSVPLLFVLAVHNIESMISSEGHQSNKVSPFMNRMISTLCSNTTVKHEIVGIPLEFYETEKMSLAELAFKGLCKGHQQLSWQKDFIESTVGSFKTWLDSGLLVLDEDYETLVKEHENISESNKKEENDKKNTENNEGLKRTLNQEEKNGGKIENVTDDTPEKPQRKKENKKKGKYKSESVADKMVTEEFFQPSTNYHLPPLPEASEKVSAPTVINDVSEVEKPHQCVSNLENEPHVVKEKTVRRTPCEVPHVVKFLHKVIQEWFAATFFCFMMRRYTSADHFRNYVFSQLCHISPTDLRYVLLFTSYLHPPSCHLIINFLLRRYRKDGHVPPYIMNCVFLCFNEHNDVKGPDMRNAATHVCKEVITIQSEDSSLLQQAKLFFLEYASSKGVLIEKLELRDVISSVNQTSLTLNSGVQLGILDTVKVIAVSCWGPVLQRDDYEAILKLLSTFTLLKEICCHFPSPPPTVLDEVTLTNCKSKDLKVEWRFGHCVHFLDSREGKWVIDFKQSDASTARTTLAITYLDCQSFLETNAIITKNGGVLDIPNTGVVLMVPPDALPENMEHCEIHIRIIPRGEIIEEVSSFSSNSSTVVQLLPDNLKFRRPVRLTLPHCLVLQRTGERKARIFISCHKTGSGPEWEEKTHLSYHLEDTACIILLDRLCWVKFSVDDEIVKAKKLIVYTALRKLQPQDEFAEIHIGYYLDLPDQIKVIEDTRDLIIKHRKSFYFIKTKEKYSLHISLENIYPKEQQFQAVQPYSREITQRQIELFVNYSLLYHIGRKPNQTSNPLCVFNVLQVDTKIPVQLTIHVKIRPDEHNSQIEKLSPSDDYQDCFISRKTISTKVGGTLEISNTGIILDIPPSALPADKEKYEIRMRYISRRTVNDQVTCFSSNSTAVVEILPDLRLRYPARLTLPHCLVLQQSVARKARIFVSHHEKGSHPRWEERKDLSYHVEDTNCIILVNNFSWYKYTINGEEVIAKKIIVYAGAKGPLQQDNYARIEVGFYPDLPENKKEFQGGQDLVATHMKIFYVFKREKIYPLQISLNNDIFRDGWKCRCLCKVPETHTQEILCDLSNEDFCDYILEKISNTVAMPLCVFTVSQVEGQIPVQLAVNLQDVDKNPLTAEVSALPIIERINNSDGQILRLSGTGVTLQIPDDAFEHKTDLKSIEMRIIHSRTVDDYVTPFCSNPFMAVELLPIGIRLRHPAKLRLPHCLIFKENKERGARIFINQEKGHPSHWEERTDIKYALQDDACIIMIHQFCCVKYSIDKEIVQGKNITIYTAAKKVERKYELAEVEVGYYIMVPGELLRMNPSFTIDSKKKFPFLEDQKSPLQVSFNDIVPTKWKCRFLKEKPREIPVEIIASSIEHSNLYILQKTDNGDESVICRFQVSQRSNRKTSLALTIQAPKVELGSEGHASGHNFEALSENRIIGESQLKLKQQQGRVNADPMISTFQYLSKTLNGNEWKSVGRRLGLRDAEVDHIIQDNTDTEERIYKMLRHWKHSNGTEATYTKLIQSLKQAGRKDLAEDVQNGKDQEGYEFPGSSFSEKT